MIDEFCAANHQSALSAKSDRRSGARAQWARWVVRPISKETDADRRRERKVAPAAEFGVPKKPGGARLIDSVRGRRERLRITKDEPHGTL